MKIGILTWFGYDNYGSVLQAFALYKYLIINGYNVKFVNYTPNGDIFGSNSIDTFVLRNKIRLCAKFEKNACIISEISGVKFQEFRECYFQLTSKVEERDWITVENEFDKFICGSDQIWSPLCFDEHYFLKFVSDRNKLISYAPSIGVEKISNKRIKIRIKELLDRFEYISVRELSGKQVLEQIIDKKIQVVADPTLLLSRKEWEKLLGISPCKSGNYLLIYFLGKNKGNWKKAYRIARKKGLSVKVIPVYKYDLIKEGAIIKGVSPQEFVSLVFNAEYICTDSFHGLAFSIIGKKQFTVFERHKKRAWNNQNSRLHSLMKILGIDKNIEYVNYKELDYKLEKFRMDSKKYLNNALGSEFNEI